MSAAPPLSSPQALPMSPFLLPLLACLATFDGTTYQKPGTPEVGGVRQLCLIYHGGQNRVAWTAEALRPYVTYVDAQGKSVDWLFDSFLMMEYIADNQAPLSYYDPKAPQPTMAEWQWLADAWFRPTTGLIGLEQAVAEAGATLGDPAHTVNVVIALPLPSQPLKEFGPLPGQDRKLDFGREEDRQAALRWYIESVQQRFRQAGYRHLRLVGFYWTAESVPTDDDAIVQWTSQCLHQQGYKFYWIPYFSADGFGRWRQLGFDSVMLQPNHFFAEWSTLRRLSLAAERAKWMGTGVEMEFDSRALESPLFRQHFFDYCDAGAKYGWMTDAIVGWYEGGSGIRAMLDHPEQGRPLYDAIYQFVRGAYRPTGQPLPPLPEPHRPQPGNLALASRGAKVLGGIRNANQPKLAPEHLIDGQLHLYTGNEHFAYFGIPGSITIELPEPAEVARCETQFWDLDDRWFQYQFDTSLDGKQWEPAIDKRDGQWHSWQVDRFAPRKAKFIRLTVLHNSSGQEAAQVVKLEVFGP